LADLRPLRLAEAGQETRGRAWQTQRASFSALLYVAPHSSTNSSPLRPRPSRRILRFDAVRIEPMTAEDWPRVRAIYEQGIATRQATFEAEPPSWEQWDSAHLPNGRLVARDGDLIVGWGALSPVSRRQCYGGVAEASVYVDESARGRGIGRALLEHLIAASEAQGIWTLQGATFPENTASLRLQERCGFRVVGRRERIARMDGLWRDTILTERRSSKVGID